MPAARFWHGCIDASATPGRNEQRPGRPDVAVMLRRVTERPSVDDILNAHHRWYHVIELEPGVTTPGFADLRSQVDHAGLPADLSGLRAIDVGTFDGFWAFELEKRGAQVIGIDVDEIPPPDAPEYKRQQILEELAGVTPGTGFELLKRWFGSSVERRSINVYDLKPDRVDGPVDLVFVGAMLLHLRNPVGALEAARATLRPGGRLIAFEVVDPALAGHDYPVARFKLTDTIWTWWRPNIPCLLGWIETAGFSDIQLLGTTTVRDATGNEQMLATVHAVA
jgi:SAM-dependent methyltransferase